MFKYAQARYNASESARNFRTRSNAFQTLLAQLLDEAAEKNAERKRIEAEEKAALEAEKPKSVSPLEAVSKLDEKSLALASGNLALLLGIPFVTIAAIYFLYITAV